MGKVIKFPGSLKNLIDPESENLMNSKPLDLKHIHDEDLSELNEVLNKVFMEHNNRPQESMLGFSPTDMSKILYSKFSLKNDFFEFECRDEEILYQAPFFKAALFILNSLDLEGPIKLTKIGNLPRAMILRIFKECFSKIDFRYFEPKRGEVDAPYISLLKELLILSGFVKKQKSKFSLTKKGEKVLKNKEYGFLYQSLMEKHVNKVNFGWLDGYPDLDILQTATAFNLILIHKKVKSWTLDKEISTSFFDVFPKAVYQLMDEDPSGFDDHTALFKNEYEYEDEKENEYLEFYVKRLKSIFCLRFLERFCIYYGLLEKKNMKFDYEAGLSAEYKITKLFNQSFIFRIKN